jgi:AraC family transcriptional regulator of adaptative response/methylated-DNA-[protein]-cysteine methyltransferase
MISTSKRGKASTRKAGKSPGSYRIATPSEEIHFGVGQSSLGSILVASSKKGIVAILIGRDWRKLVRALEQRFPLAHLVRGDRGHDNLVAQVVDFVEAPAGDLDLPLDVRGTAFQKRVWQAVGEIPAGETTTYTEIARMIGVPKAMRAVGNACSNNPIAIAIPCHRVLRKDGPSSDGRRRASSRQQTLIRREATP